MRLGPALLVVLLPLIAWADYTSTSNEDETIQTASVHSSNSVPLPLSKPTSSTSKTSTSTNTIPPDKPVKFINKDNSKLNSTLHIDGKDGLGKFREEIRVQHLEGPYKTKTLQTESLKAPLTKKKNLTVGYLTAVRGELKERQGLSVSGALTMALDEVIYLK